MSSQDNAAKVASGRLHGGGGTGVGPSWIQRIWIFRDL